MKTAFLAFLVFLATATAAEPSTWHVLETTYADTALKQTNWTLPKGYLAKVQTMSQTGGSGNVMRWTSQETGSSFEVLPGMNAFPGPGRFFLSSERSGFNSNPRQLVVLEVVPMIEPKLAVVERSPDLTNWTAVARVYLTPDADAPALFYRLALPDAP